MILYKKLGRDLWNKKDSNLAVIILVALGILIFSSFDMLGKNLHYSQQSFYDSHGFADGFIELKHIPYTKVEPLHRIEGIERIEGRIIETAKITYENSRDDIYLKLISFDDEVNHINRFLLQEGDYPSAEKYEVLLDSRFAEFHHLKTGDVVNIIKNGTETRFTVSGIGASPEFIYSIKDIRDILPNYDTYGIAAVSKNTAEKMTDLDQQYNDLVFTLKEGYEFSDVNDALKSSLKNYHISSIIPRKYQTSHVIVDGEVVEAKTMSLFIPLLFLFISSMIQIMMLERLVQSQRSQIGILKAFGYSDRRILHHYMLFSVILGVAGSALGILLSIPALSSFVRMYHNFFNFPYISRTLYPSSLTISTVMGISFSALAGYIGAKKTLALSPLEAFKAEEPHYVQRKTILDSFLFLFHTFGRMSVRNISRNRKRSLFILFGIMLSFSLSATVFILSDIRDTVILAKYDYSEIYDAKIHFQYPVRKSLALQELQRYRGISEAEALLEIPVSIYHENITKDVSVTGIEENTELYHILDEDDKRIPLRKNDLFLSQRLADILRVKVGDSIYIKSFLMKNPEKVKRTVTKIVKQNVGLGIYMERNDLEELLQQKNIATSIIFRANKDLIETMQKDYEESPLVSNIVHSDKMKQKMLDFLQTFAFMTYVFSGFGIVMCFIVIYNSYTISISERSRELSSLLVLGMSRKEVSQIIALEQKLIAACAIILGIPLTKVFLHYVSLAISDDTFTVPTDFNFQGLVWAFVCVAVSIALAQLSGNKKINDLVIVEVLKERE